MFGTSLKNVLRFTKPSGVKIRDHHVAGQLQLESLEDRLTPVFGAPLLASVASGGADSGNAASHVEASALSGDGRYLVFTSESTNLVAGITDANGSTDVFRRDLMTGVTQAVSVRPTGIATGNFASYAPAISVDGRYVAFQSDATNLVGTVGNGLSQIYVRDMQTQTTVCASVSNSGGAFGNGGSFGPRLSGDGRRVVFQSGASNLAASDSNNAFDVFMRDFVGGVTSLISVKSTGGSGNAASGVGGYTISQDGTAVAFASNATNLVVGVTDSNGAGDIFVRRIDLGTTSVVSVNAAGIATGNAQSGQPTISADGSRIAFVSRASDLGPVDGNNADDIYVRDLSANVTSAASMRSDGMQTAAGGVQTGFITTDGHSVFFSSGSSDIAGATSGFLQIFVRNLTAQQSSMVSVNTTATGGGNAHSYLSFLAGQATDSGNRVAFISLADDLAVGDANGQLDVFVRDRVAGATTLASRPISGVANGASDYPQISNDGGRVAFSSNATNLAGLPDGNGGDDVFVVGEINPPTVANVWFDGTTWSPAFRAAAGNSVYGYPAQTGAGQLVSMPWRTINRIHVQFSQDVVVDAPDLAVRGVNAPVYSLADFAYDPATFVASWTIGPLDTDRLILDLDGDSVGAVQTTTGTKLAGGWNEGIDSFPTAGASGVDFRYRFNVLVGNADRSIGFVSNADVNAVRAQLFFSPATPGYDLFRDIDGSGTILNADANAVRNALFTDLPGGIPSRGFSMAVHGIGAVLAGSSSRRPKSPPAPTVTRGNDAPSRTPHRTRGIINGVDAGAFAFSWLMAAGSF